MEERLSASSDDYVELLFHWHRYRSVEPWIAGKVVLDLGFGTGFGAHHMSHYAETVTAIDINQSTVDTASAQFRRSNLHYLCASVDSVPLQSGTIDVITAFEILEHLPHEIQERLITEARRLLKPNGVLFISTPDRARTEQFAEENPYHLGELTEPEFRNALAHHFPSVSIYHQEVNAASFIWNPEISDVSAPAIGYGIQIVDGTSKPSPPIHGSHLNLIAVCTVEPQNIVFGGYCAEVDRHVLETLWNSLGRKDWELKNTTDKYAESLSALQTREIQLKDCERIIEELRRQNDVFRGRNETLERDNRIMALAYAESQTSKESLSQMELIHGALMHESLKLRENLEQIENMRTWKMIQKYRHIMDHTVWGRPLRMIRRLLIGKGEPN